MYTVDWNITGVMLQGIGNVLLGIAALLTLFLQFGYRKKSNDLEASLRLLLVAYRRYMASEEGIVLSDYAREPDAVLSGLVRDTGLERQLLKRLLDHLQAEGKLK
jgi:hypothetical protein